MIDKIKDKLLSNSPELKHFKKITIRFSIILSYHFIKTGKRQKTANIIEKLANKKLSTTLTKLVHVELFSCF